MMWLARGHRYLRVIPRISRDASFRWLPHHSGSTAKPSANNGVRPHYLCKTCSLTRIDNRRARSYDPAERILEMPTRLNWIRGAAVALATFGIVVPRGPLMADPPK